jgi:hypothetical protein
MVEDHAVIEALADQFLDAVNVAGGQVGTQLDRDGPGLERQQQGVFEVGRHGHPLRLEEW